MYVIEKLASSRKTIQMKWQKRNAKHMSKDTDLQLEFN